MKLFSALSTILCLAPSAHGEIHILTLNALLPSSHFGFVDITCTHIAFFSK